MKKFTFPLLLILIVCGPLFPQSLVFRRLTPFLLDGRPGSTVVHKAVLKNTSSTTYNFTYARFINNLGGPSWYSSMCAGGYCYGGTVDTVPPAGMPLSIGPGQTDTLILEVNGLTEGGALIKINAYMNNNPSVCMQDSFRVILWLAGISKISGTAEDFELKQNYPNPFNPSAIIEFSIRKPDITGLYVYDITGKEIARLIDNVFLSAGKYSVNFDCSLYNLSGGVYFYRLTSGNLSKTKKMMLIK